MKRALRGVVVLLLLLLGGCASQSSSNLPDVPDPNRAASLNAELGLNFMQQGQYHQAMIRLKRALRYNPRSVAANHYMGELDRQLKQYDEAGKYFRRALRYAPRDQSNAMIHNNYGIYLCEVKRYGEAEKQFLDVVKDPVYPGRAQTYENLGLCLQREPAPKKAAFYFRQALKINPKRPKSLMGLATINYDEGHYSEALTYLKRYHALVKPNPKSLWLGIRIARKLGNVDAAASYGMLLKNQFPDSDETQSYLRTEQP